MKNTRHRFQPSIPLRARSLVMVLVLVAACSGPRDATVQAVPQFSNLVLVVIDALRADSLACYGYHRDTAPFLGRLASEGLQVTAYSASSWTRPSTATILTGLYPQRHQTNRRDQALPFDAPYFPQLMASSGRRTGAIMSNGNVSADFGFSRGFAEFIQVGGEEKATTEEEFAAADQLMAQMTSPFFVYFHVVDPHDPYEPADYWHDSPFRGQGTESYVQPEQILENRAPADQQTLARMKDLYDAEILELDQALQAFFLRLADRGLLENTLVVVTSDHGEEFGEHGNVVHGHALFEESVAVPLIFWSADQRLARARQAELFHHVDLAPTLLEALAVDAPPGLDGVSRWLELSVGTYRGPDAMLLHLDLDHFQLLGIRRGNQKYILDRPTGLAELFDLAADPLETSAAGLAGIVQRRRLRAELERIDADLANRALEPRTAQIGPATEANLRALGYID